jgi:hypothetical protein
MNATTETTPTLVRLPLVRLTKDARAVKNAVTAFRKQLEREVLDRGGGGLAIGSLVHTAATAMRRHLQAERRMHEEAKTLGLRDWLDLADRSLKWKQAVDKCLAGLGLDRREVKDVWDAIYSTPVAAATAPPQLQDEARSDAEPASDAGAVPAAPDASCADAGALPGTPGEAAGPVPPGGG